MNSHQTWKKIPTGYLSLMRLIQTLLINKLRQFVWRCLMLCVLLLQQEGVWPGRNDLSVFFYLLYVLFI